MAAAPYANGALRVLLHQYKYSGILESGGELVGAMGDFTVRFERILSGLLGPGAVVVPVPLHPWREAWRGFNQAEKLAAAAAVSIGLPARRLLRRRFGWRRQTQLDSPLLRQGNVERAIFLAPGARVPEAVLLVDDVFTTGATLSACARALRARGAMRVWGLTLLRG
jgi:predicted amidophosphoribosyltransferase